MQNENIRVILRKHIEEESLRKFLGNKFDSTHHQTKKKYLKGMEDAIEAKIDTILSAFISQMQSTSPEVKKRRSLAIINIIVTALAQVGIGYGVNVEGWIFVSIISLMLLAFQGYMIKSGY